MNRAPVKYMCRYVRDAVSCCDLMKFMVLLPSVSTLLNKVIESRLEEKCAQVCVHGDAVLISRPSLHLGPLSIPLR